MLYRLKTDHEMTVESWDIVGAEETVAIPMSVFRAAFELVPGGGDTEKAVSVRYDELDRAAKLLDEFAAESHREATNVVLSAKDRREWLSEGLAYETAAKRLRNVQLTKG